MQAFQAHVSRKMKDQFSEMYAFIHESVTSCVKHRLGGLPHLETFT